MAIKILLADDSLTIQKVVELTFSDAETRLKAVGSGDRAVQALDDFQPDLVLADVVMPGLTGYDVCEAVKQRPGGAFIPVVLLTGTFEPFDRARAERVGSDAIVTKPFDSHALQELARELVTKARAAREEAAAAPAAAPVAAPEPPPTMVLSAAELESAFPSAAAPAPDTGATLVLTPLELDESAPPPFTEAATAAPESESIYSTMAMKIPTPAELEESARREGILRAEESLPWETGEPAHSGARAAGPAFSSHDIPPGPDVDFTPPPLPAVAEPEAFAIEAAIPVAAPEAEEPLDLLEPEPVTAPPSPPAIYEPEPLPAPPPPPAFFAPEPSVEVAPLPAFDEDETPAAPPPPPAFYEPEPLPAPPPPPAFFAPEPSVAPPPPPAFYELETPAEPPPPPPFHAVESALAPPPPLASYEPEPVSAPPPPPAFLAAEPAVEPPPAPTFDEVELPVAPPPPPAFSEPEPPAPPPAPVAFFVSDAGPDTEPVRALETDAAGPEPFGLEAAEEPFVVGSAPDGASPADEVEIEPEGAPAEAPPEALLSDLAPEAEAEAEAVAAPPSEEDAAEPFPEMDQVVPEEQAADLWEERPVEIPPPPPELAGGPEDSEGAEPITRDLEADLEAFEASGRVRRRPEIWERHAALIGEEAPADIDLGAVAPPPPPPEPAEPEPLGSELEEIAAASRLEDLSALIPPPSVSMVVPEAQRESRAVTTAPIAPSAPGALSDADVDRIARRVVELLSDKAVRDVAWEVVPEVAERLVRERIAEVERAG